MTPWLLLLSLQLGASAQAVTEDTLREWAQNYRDSLVGTQFTFTHEDETDESDKILIQGAYASIPYQGGSLHRLETTWMVTNGDRKTTKTRVLLQRNDGFYEIEDNGQGWLLTQYIPEFAQPFKNYDISTDFDYISAPVSRLMTPFDSIFPHHSEFSYRSTLMPSSRTHHIQTKETPLGKQEATSLSDYWMEDGLIKKSIIRRASTNQTITRETVYQTLNGKKFPQEITTQNLVINPPLHSITRFSPVEVCTKDPSYFSLTQFGMPEAEGIDLGRPTPVWVWLLAAAAGLMLLALLFRTLQQRAIRKEST
ncbi:hypothetical protein [Tuwongella immobilis]|uniref:Uncharacterized protein n=1 Tax=Tuwongella immobilis TaxID=692036 RepID=A0A6C2YX18_9BACT|nr:hypothetical protein [Tuwongella immobilis]VIP05382.1 unnamed protein product [Tuwongella immobilis]VTS08120.1 unnamed protein product [Tuwongella immobilis]